MNRLHTSVISLLTAICAICTMAGTAGASVFQHEEHLHLTNLHRIDDDLYTFSEDITVDGYIDGDLASFTYSFRLNGEVTGSANIFAYELNHTGAIGRTLRGFANSITIDGTVGHSSLLMGESITIGRAAVIERDLHAIGSTVRLYGTVRGDQAVLKGDRIIVEGLVDGDLEIDGTRIEIASTAVISGNLTYESKVEDNLTVAEGATISGTVTWVEPDTDEADEDEGSDVLRSIVLSISKLLAAFLFGIILTAVFRRHAQESYQQLQSQFSVAIAAGFISLIVLAFAVVILAVSVVLMIAGLVLTTGENAILGAFILVFSILMFPITSFATVAGSIIMYAGKIVLGYLIGSAILGRIRKPSALGAISLLTGLVILTIVFSIPYIGFVIYLLVSITGAGAIVLGVRHCRRQANGGPSSPPSVTPPPSPDQPRD